MKLLILGDDGRAHALVWKLFNSPQVSELICAPGNGGTALIAPQADLDQRDVVALGRWAFEEGIDLIVPATSDALVAGLVDEVVSYQLSVCGPAQRAVRVEQSRCFLKELLLRYGLPTASGRPFDKLDTAEKYLATQPLPVAIKADHPDGGEAMYEDRYSALQGLHELFAAHPLHGTSNGVVIESCLRGMRIVQSALTDGSTALPLLPVRLYEHLDEGETGPLVPGMGANTGTSVYAQKLRTYIHSRLLAPLVAALAKEDLPYWGFLGVDTIVTDKGPCITGVRCSLRDLEAQVVLPRLQDDLFPLIQTAITRRLHQIQAPSWRDEASVGIGLVARGYPHSFPVGGAITGLTDLDEGVFAFHSHTHNPNGLRYTHAARAGRGALASLLMGNSPTSAAMSTTGGHVLTIVALGATTNGARSRALLNAERITFPGRSFRNDIGLGDFS